MPPFLQVAEQLAVSVQAEQKVAATRRLSSINNHTTDLGGNFITASYLLGQHTRNLQPLEDSEVGMHRQAWLSSYLISCSRLAAFSLETAGVAT